MAQLPEMHAARTMGWTHPMGGHMGAGHCAQAARKAPTDVRFAAR